MTYNPEYADHHEHRQRQGRGRRESDRPQRVNWGLIVALLGLLTVWMTTILTKSEDVQNRLTSLEAARDETNRRFSDIDRKLDRVDVRVEKVDGKVDRILERVNNR